MPESLPPPPSEDHADIEVQMASAPMELTRRSIRASAQVTPPPQHYPNRAVPRQGTVASTRFHPALNQQHDRLRIEILRSGLRIRNPKVLSDRRLHGVSRDFTAEAPTSSSAAPGRLHTASPVTSRNVGFVARRCVLVLNPRLQVIRRSGPTLAVRPLAVRTPMTAI